MKESKFKGLALHKEDSLPRQAEEAPAAAKPSRAVGKRQDPAYQQISAYVRRDLYDAIRRELIGVDTDFSDLLEEWMKSWLEKRTKG